MTELEAEAHVFAQAWASGWRDAYPHYGQARIRNEQARASANAALRAWRASREARVEEKP